MNKPTQKLTVEERKALKEKHRIESVMQEAGERFEPDSVHTNIWRSITTKDLIVDTRLQAFEAFQPGIGSKRGDVISWLMLRNGWNFPQAIRYLQNRPSDPKQETQLQTVAPVVLLQKVRQYESEFRDEEKEASGLYDCGGVYRAGKTFYSYLPKPQDRQQERALEIGGEEMRDYFDCKSWELLKLRDEQYHRFRPILDTWIDTCDECEEVINWGWKQKPQFAYTPMPGQTASWEKVRVYPEHQVFAWQVETGCDDDDFILCEDCKHKHINFYTALDLLYISAYKREAPQREREKQEAQAASRKAENDRILEEQRLERLWKAQEYQCEQGKGDTVIARRGERA
jgi:hypothetical protein